MDNKKQERDYKHEYLLRKRNRKRMVCEIEREKANHFETVLNDHGLTYSEWLNKRIDIYISEEK